MGPTLHTSQHHSDIRPDDGPNSGLSNRLHHITPQHNTPASLSPSPVTSQRNNLRVYNNNIALQTQMVLRTV